jgi:hypothetical protein
MAITATVAQTFLSTIFFVLACPTESRTGTVFIIIVTPMSPTFDINIHSTRPDVHPLGELNGMLLRGGWSGQECAAGNDRDAQDDPVHEQSFPRRKSPDGAHNAETTNLWVDGFVPTES